MREILRHPSVESVELCEIDRRVVEVCTEHLKETSCRLADPRVNLVFEDGIEYVKRFKSTYDCIIVDSPDPVGPATGLFSADFYRSVFESLTEDGVFTAQTESPFTDEGLIRRVTRDVAAVFPIGGFYIGNIPTYPAGMWGFTMGLHHPEGWSLTRQRLRFRPTSCACICLPVFRIPPKPLPILFIRYAQPLVTEVIVAEVMDWPMDLLTLHRHDLLQSTRSFWVFDFTSSVGCSLASLVGQNRLMLPSIQPRS